MRQLSFGLDTLPVRVLAQLRLRRCLLSSARGAGRRHSCSRGMRGGWYMGVPVLLPTLQQQQAMHTLAQPASNRTAGSRPNARCSARFLESAASSASRCSCVRKEGAALSARLPGFLIATESVLARVWLSVQPAREAGCSTSELRSGPARWGPSLGSLAQRLLCMSRRSNHAPSGWLCGCRGWGSSQACLMPRARGLRNSPATP